MHLYLIRHLPTAWNDKGVLQGTKDISISMPDNETLKEIETNKAKLNTITPDVVLVSQLIRTRETAELYNYLNVTTEPLLNELNFGPFEGKPKKEMLEVIGDAWYKNASQVTLGENLNDFEVKLTTFLEKYKMQ